MNKASLIAAKFRKENLLQIVHEALNYTVNYVADKTRKVYFGALRKLYAIGNRNIKYDVNIPKVIEEIKKENEDVVWYRVVAKDVYLKAVVTYTIACRRLIWLLEKSINGKTL